MIPFQRREDVQAALKYINDNFPAATEPQKMLKAMFKTFAGLQLTKAGSPEDAERSLKDFAAASRKISHLFIKAASPDIVKKTLCFDSRHGTYVTLCMVVKDSLIKAYGGDGRYLANLFTQLVHEYPRAVGVKLKWQEMLNPFEVVARFMREEGVNPFRDVRVLEVGAEQYSRMGIEPFAKMFGEFKFAGDNSNLTALKDGENYITPANARKMLGNGFDYVVSSNVLSPYSVYFKKYKTYTWEDRNRLPEGFSEKDFFKENAKLMAALAGASKDKAVHFHINCYNEERSPCLFDAEFHKFTGLSPLAAKEFFGNGGGQAGMYFYQKKGEEKLKAAEVEKWLEENTANWKGQSAGRELVGKIPLYMRHSRSPS